MPPSETALVGIQRELREETGLDATEWRELCRLDLSNSVTDEQAVLFVASGLRHGQAAPEPTESIALRWVPFDEALAMTMDGRITDAMSVVAIQRLALERMTLERRGGRVVMPTGLGRHRRRARRVRIGRRLLGLHPPRCPCPRPRAVRARPRQRRLGRP